MPCCLTSISIAKPERDPGSGPLGQAANSMLHTIVSRESEFKQKLEQELYGPNTPASPNNYHVALQHLEPQPLQGVRRCCRLLAAQQVIAAREA